MASDGRISVADAQRLVASASDGRGITATESRDLRAVAGLSDGFITRSARKLLTDGLAPAGPVFGSREWRPVRAAPQSVRDEWRATRIGYPRNPNTQLPPVREETGARAANPFKLQFSIVAGERRVAILEDALPASTRPVPSDDDRPTPQRRAIQPGNPGFWLNGQRTLHRSMSDVPADGIANRKNDYQFLFDWDARTLTITRYDEFYGTVDAPGREQATRSVVTKWVAPLPQGF